MRFLLSLSTIHRLTVHKSPESTARSIGGKAAGLPPSIVTPESRARHARSEQKCASDPAESCPRGACETCRRWTKTLSSRARASCLYVLFVGTDMEIHRSIAAEKVLLANHKKAESKLFRDRTRARRWILKSVSVYVIEVVQKAKLYQKNQNCKK